MYPSEIFRRSEHNPIITVKDMPYPCNVVFNPGATEIDGQTLLLLRVDDLEGRSHLTVARSDDGVTGWDISDRPLLSPADGEAFEGFGCGDARLSYLDELGEWVIAYTAHSRYGTGVALAFTSDFVSVRRLGIVLAPNNRDAAVFPRMIDGKYLMVHRPEAGSVQHIWMTDSVDLMRWGNPRCVLEEKGGPYWDGYKVGANCVPIETEDGWLLLYHGVKMALAGPTYRMGAALLHLDDPTRLISRLPYWILGPQKEYELSRERPNTVFSCGHVQKGDTIYLYYGVADTSVCLATASLSKILAELRKHRVVPQLEPASVCI